MIGKKATLLRPNVLRIESTNNGFGFVVAEDKGLLYVITAYHLVFGSSSEPSKSDSLPKIEVIFFSDQGVNYKAEYLVGDVQHDLALIRVRMPMGLNWDKQSLAPASDEKRGTPVWFVGRDGQWSPPAVSGAINADGANANGWLDAFINGLRPGSSGGPLVTNTGIIGMIKGQTPDDTKVLSIGFIERQVRDWGYPWNLTVGTPSEAVASSGEISPYQQLAEPPNLKADFARAERRVEAANVWIATQRKLHQLQNEAASEHGYIEEANKNCRELADNQDWDGLRRCINRLSPHLDKLESLER